MHPNYDPSRASAFNDRFRAAGTTRDLRMAIWNHEPGTVERILAQGGVNLNEVAGGRTALMEAAELGNAHAVTALLRHGADPNLLDPNGRTARALAADNGHEAVAALFGEPHPVPAPGHWSNVGSPDRGRVLERTLEEHARRSLSRCMIP